MNPEQASLLERRQAAFEKFYAELMPALVEFTGNLGISPAHEVLNHAVRFAPLLDVALANMAVANERERTGLVARVAYFVGKYFVQKYDGCWYVNGIAGSRYFARYVVGQFALVTNAASMLDPMDIAQVYVDEPLPRNLEKLLQEVESELNG